jgi:hypothetical protein
MNVLRYGLIALCTTAFLYALGFFIVGPNLGSRTRVYAYSWGSVTGNATLPPPLTGWRFDGFVAGPRYKKRGFPSLKVRLSGEVFSIGELTEEYVVAHGWIDEYAGAEPSEFRHGARIFSNGAVEAIFRFGTLFGFAYSGEGGSAPQRDTSHSSGCSGAVAFISEEGRMYCFPMNSGEVRELFGEPAAMRTKWYYL